MYFLAVLANETTKIEREKEKNTKSSRPNNPHTKVLLIHVTARNAHISYILFINEAVMGSNHFIIKHCRNQRNRLPLTEAS